LAKLKDKPFPLYDLAASVWDGTAATGDFAESAIPPTATNSIKPSTNSTKTATKPIKLTPAEKRKLISADDDNTDIDVEPTASVQTNTTAPTKRVRENKNQIIKTKMDGVNSAINTVTETSKELMGAFSKIATAMSSNNPIPPSQSNLSNKSLSDMAIDQCSQFFLGKVVNEMYVDFVSILKDESKARTFLALSRNSNHQICQIWLDKEVKKVKKIE
jgi:hypothetical protein